MTAVESQLEMPFRKRPEQMDVSDEVIRTQPTSRAALSLAIAASGLEDQEVCKRLGIDAGYWSRIRSGKNGVTSDIIIQLNEILGNTIYLKWLNYRCGHECKPLLSTLEQQLEAERQRLAEVEKENELMRKLLSGRK